MINSRRTVSNGSQFSIKKALLSLYNAGNNSSYENEDELEINTLEDAIYMRMKNDIYSSKLIELPTPQFLVFYNGTDNIEDHVVLRLSEAFTSSEVEPCLECVAHVYNINHGRNRQIMSKCRKLEGYSIFIERIRQGQEQHITIEKAV